MGLYIRYASVDDCDILERSIRIPEVFLYRDLY